jgi:hypothetical protein
MALYSVLSHSQELGLVLYMGFQQQKYYRPEMVIFVYFLFKTTRTTRQTHYLSVGFQFPRSSKKANFVYCKVKTHSRN